MNATNSSAPPTSVTSTTGSSQPRSGCSISPNVMPASETAHSTAPAKSIRVPGRRGASAGMARATISSVPTTSGMLSAKIQRQEAASTSWPPTTGPSTVPMPAHAVQAPTARPRSWGGNVRTITASAAGVSSAPETPCSARAATSVSIVGASAQNSEVPPKPATPAMNTRRSRACSRADLLTSDVPARGRAGNDSVMRQLTSLDAQFLAVESARTYGHVGGLAVYDPDTAPGGELTVPDVCRLVAERLHLLPPFRWRLHR